MGAKLRPSPAMAVAVTALVFAAGGTSYAVSQLPAASVGAKQLKSQSVTAPKLKTGAVTTQKLGNQSITRTKLATASVTGQAIARNSVSGGHVLGNSLTGDQIDEVTLGTVPSAATAGIAGLTFASVRGPSLEPGYGGSAHVECAPGASPIGGGVRVDDPSSMVARDAYPQGHGWTANVSNFGSSAAGFAVHVVCAQASGAAPQSSKARSDRRYPVAGR
jgi:hypothetical protein